MASHTGVDGVLKYDSNPVAELTSWTLDHNQEPVESTALGSSARSFKPGITNWTGSAECFWDETDTNGQVALAIGSSVTMNFYPEGATAGDRYATGTATVVGATVTAETDGIVETSFSFTGNGDLTWGAAS